MSHMPCETQRKKAMFGSWLSDSWATQSHASPNAARYRFPRVCLCVCHCNACIPSTYLGSRGTLTHTRARAGRASTGFSWLARHEIGSIADQPFAVCGMSVLMLSDRATALRCVRAASRGRRRQFNRLGALCRFSRTRTWARGWGGGLVCDCNVYV